MLSGNLRIRYNVYAHVCDIVEHIDAPSARAKAVTKDRKQVVPDGNNAEAVADFLKRVAATPQTLPSGSRGRLLFAMDATASREASWDAACQIQGDMFAETATLGGLDVQMAFYRGFREFRASPWVSSSTELIPYMTRVRCRGGHTQLERVLRYAAKETDKNRISALVFVGDCLEEEIDRVCDAAGALGLKGVPCFMFHEGQEPRAARGFREVARLTHGAYCTFDIGSARQLRDLLAAVAVFAAGGRKALGDYSRGKSAATLQIAHQLERG